MSVAIRAAGDVGAGLTTREAAQRAASGLANAAGPGSSRSLWSILRANLLTYFNGLVLTGFIVLVVLGTWRDALFGLTALANAVIGIAQEYRTKRSLDRLSVLNAPLARVLRDGAEREVRREQVVLDDVLILRSGDQVPADATVLGSEHLSVDQALLTGESEPVACPPGSRVLSGSSVVSGSARARVTAVGSRAFAGRLAAESRRFSLVRSELREAIDRLLHWIGWAVLPLSLLMLNAQMQVQGGWDAAGHSGRWHTAAVDTVAVLIAMVPLGLVLITSIAFAVGAASLARQQVLTQELAAVEGLARVDVLCIDKTGTLTDRAVGLEEVRPYSAPGVPTERAWAAALGWFAAAPSAGPTVHALGARFPPDPAVHAGATIEFSSTRKWSAAALDGPAAGTWVLGAPEIVAALPGSGAASPATTAAVVRDASALAASGSRVLLLAHASGPLTAADASEERPPRGLNAVALLVFRERLRADAARTLAYFREQGVEVRVLSGDDPGTVTAVAEAAGLAAGPGVDARTLPEDPAAFAEAVLGHRVLGRVTPAQKRAAVHALQAAGRTVAMTGDGVNDALAVKDADLGIAMGSGAAATKAVSRLVLLDDAFAHLPHVVAEGRKVTANVERVSVLFLTKTTYAMALSAVLGLLLVQTPFLPRQLFITDGLTIGIPAVLLALLPSSRRYRPGFLRRALGFAVPNGLIVAACLVTLTLAARTAGIGIDAVRTCTTFVLTAVGLWVLSCQARPLRGARLLILIGMVGAAIALFTFPPTAAFLAFAAPPDGFAALSAAVAAAGCLAVEVTYRVRRRRVAA